MGSDGNGRAGRKAPKGRPVHGAGHETSMSAAAELFKAVSHPVRAQILEQLSHGESSIPELCEGTGVKDTHLSRHLTQMRGQHLIQRVWSRGRLVYRLAYPEVTGLLAAARAVLHARSAPQFGPPGRAPEEVPYEALDDEQFSALEASLSSRSVIAEACQAIAARSGCSPEAAAGRLIMAARNNNRTLLQAARAELRN